jgi:hypothetical protein
MQMMLVLKPIAFDVIICMTQLFDYYLYAVSIFCIRFNCLICCNGIKNHRCDVAFDRRKTP